MIPQETKEKVYLDIISICLKYSIGYKELMNIIEEHNPVYTREDIN